MSVMTSEISRVEGMGETQKTAFEALRAGKAFGDAALAAGVARSTVYRWISGDPHFRAAYNSWQQELAASARARLLKLTDQAVNVVEDSLGRRDQHVAMGVLKNMGVMRGPERETTDPQVLALQMELKHKEEEYQAALGLMKHLLTKMGLTPSQQRQYIRQHGTQTRVDGSNKAKPADNLLSAQAIEAALAAGESPGDPGEGAASDGTGATGDETGGTGDETGNEVSHEIAGAVNL